MKYTFLLLAYRYLQAPQKDRALNMMRMICFISIALATGSLALIICIINGFEKATHEQLQSLYPDLIINIQQNHTQDTYDAIMHIPEKHPEVIAISPHKTMQALITIESHETPIMVQLKAIDPAQESKTTALFQKIIMPKQNVSPLTILHGNKVLIGASLAKQLQISIQDSIIILYSPDEPKKRTLTFYAEQASIGGIFKTGIDEFDTNMVYCSQSFFENLFPDEEISEVSIKLKNPHNETLIQQTLRQELPDSEIYSWKELYPALFSSLALEKYAIGLILLLIITIASMNTIALLCMYITQKKRDIALFTVFGMPQYKMRLLFMMISFYITAQATCIGLISAYGIAIVLQKYPILSLPEQIYFTNTLPMSIDLTIFLIIFIASIIVSSVGAYSATQIINRSKAADKLKYK